MSERDAADGLDLAQAERAVGPGSGQDDADGAPLLLFGQRPEQEIDGKMRAVIAARRDLEGPGSHC